NKNAKREVISSIWNKEKSHIICFRHFAMHVTFALFGGNWYICINPTYICTSQGYRKSRFSEHYVTGKKALETNSTSLILSHNHPSGSLRPSQADENLTYKLKSAAAYFDIRILDHIIVSEEGYYSFADNGLIV
ncbi:MAG: hypothetical protein EOP48_31090, partial [Sphingobacteriales bacterium]